MEPHRTPSTSTQNSSLSSPSNERPLPPDELASRRFCQRCAKYIEHPPFIVSVCCGNSYHDMCILNNLGDREAACIDCQKKPVNYFRDTEFAREATKYDWSFFAPEPDEDSYSVSVQDTESQGPGVPAGEMALPQEQVAPALPIANIKPSDLQVALTEAQQGLATRQQELPAATIKPSNLKVALAETKQDLAVKQQALHDTEETARMLTELTDMVKSHLSLDPPSGADSVSPVTMEPIARPSEHLHIGKMTTAMERVLAEYRLPNHIEHLIGRKGYKFIHEMMIEGAVPKWVTICNAKETLPGKGANITNPAPAGAFFRDLQHHLDELEEDQPFFITFASRRTNEAGEPELVSPVMRVFRYPGQHSLILLHSTNQPIYDRPLCRLFYSSFENGTDLVKHLKFLMLSSNPDMAAFVRPTKSGQTPAKGLDSLDMKAFIQRYPPCDFGGAEATSDRKILLAAAQSLGLERIHKDDAKAVKLLDDIIGSDLRRTNLGGGEVDAHLKELGYSKYKTEILTPPSLMYGLKLPPQEANLELIRLQYQLGLTVQEMQAALPAGEKGYIRIQLGPATPSFPEEILLLACDSDRYYLVNMKNKAVSTQCSSNLRDICDYCKVFMAGCSINEAQITSFISSRLKKTRAS